MELMVAVVCAGAVALVAFGMWKNVHGACAGLRSGYLEDSGQALQNLVRTKNRVLRGGRGVMENRY